MLYCYNYTTTYDIHDVYIDAVFKFSNCYATCYKWYNPAVVNNVIKRLGNRRK